MDPEVLNKYEFTVKPGLYNFHGFGEIDLYRLTLKEADKLFAKGFKWMKLKDQVKTEKAAGKKPDKKNWSK